MNWIAFSWVIVVASWVWSLADSLDYIYFRTWEYKSDHKRQKVRIFVDFLVAVSATAVLTGLTI